MQTATSDTYRWMVLNDEAIMAVAGPQAHSFLQGQVTCDIRELKPGASRVGAHCDPKGRMQVTFRALAESEERILLRIPRTMIPAIKASLGKYIAFSKAELSEATYQIRGLYGPQARETLTGLLAAPAQEDGAWVDHEGAVILTLGPERFECWLSPEQVATLDEALGTAEPGDERWHLLDIRAGIGSVLPETQGQFTPQQLNYTQIGAVSFRKGCYTGQEIVARLHYKGKLKHHMRRLVVDTRSEEQSDALTPGSPVFIEGGKKVGELVNAAKADAGEWECLGVIEDQALEQPLRVNNTFPAKPLSLPYTLE